MMRKSAVAVLALAVALSTSGCASILSPGPDKVPVMSHPSGATVKLDGVEVGKTPCVVKVPRDSDGLFTLEQEGHEPFTVDRDRVMNGLTCLNLLLPYVCPAGFLIDVVTGNIGKYSVKPLMVHFTPDGPKVLDEKPEETPKKPAPRRDIGSRSRPRR